MDNGKEFILCEYNRDADSYRYVRRSILQGFVHLASVICLSMVLARFPQLIDILIFTSMFEAKMPTVPVMSSTAKCIPNFKTSSLHVSEFNVCLYLSTR